MRFVATRPGVFIVAHFAVVTIGLAQASFTLSSDPFGNLPARFDAGWYGGIALDGYEWDGHFDRQRNFAFFPALPMLMRPVGALFGMKAPGLPRERRMVRALWAAVAISLAAFLLALVYLARLTRLLAGADAAVSAPLLLAAYPLRGVLQCALHRRTVPAGIGRRVLSLPSVADGMASLFGLLVGFSRPNGCLVSVPLGLMAAQATWQDWRAGRKQALPLG